MNNKYVLKQSVCLTLASTLLEFLTELPDLNLLWVGWQNSQVTPLQLGLDLSACQNLSADGRDTNSYLKLKPESTTQPRSPLPQLSPPLEPATSSAWVTCPLALQQLPTHLQLAKLTADTPLFFILGMSDRFQVLWQAGCDPDPSEKQRSAELTHQISLICNGPEINHFCTALREQTLPLPPIATALEAAMAAPLPTNAATLQSDLTLRLLMALEANPPQAATSVPTSYHLQETDPQDLVETRSQITTIYQQRHWL
ncbi:MAG TPA: hypothetical protein V6D04_02500, partial [Candidatus Obscuribacterales bacterium]